MANIIIKPGDRSYDPNARKMDPAATKMEATIALVLGKAGVPMGRIDECLAWAFGRDAFYIAPCLWPGRWNKLHPKAFRAKRDEKFVDFLYVVGFSYCVKALKKGMKEEGQ